MYRVIVLTSLLLARTSWCATPPNIVFLLADDLGWNDVGFHGSNQIPTPNIDALAYSGVILNRYYVQPMCTPSRAALMTGKYPIHTGMQHAILLADEDRGLPLEEKLLPQYLKELGYSTHAVGKWHLGFYKKEYTPEYRGFDSHFGYWTAKQDFYDHTTSELGPWGYDMRRGLETAWDAHGVYSTDAFTSEAVSIIERHEATSPLFLYLSHLAVHAANPYNPLPVPDYLVPQFDNITHYPRRKFAAMLTKLDESVGRVVDALREKGMLSNTIIVFSTDNGGPADGLDANAASNWPLRGVKYLLWEGGIRGAALVWTSSLQPAVSNQMMHISDWLPTLLSAANFTKDLGELDGVDQWESISTGVASKRNEILHNIDDVEEVAGLTKDNWKILKGPFPEMWNQWYGPTGRESDLIYDLESVQNSLAGRAVSSVGKILDPEKMLKLRSEAEVSCGDLEEKSSCKPSQSPCLFNIQEDPCELNNLAQDYPLKLEELQRRLDEYNSTAVAPSNRPTHPASNPRFWNYTWTNFGDYPSPLPADTSDLTLPHGFRAAPLGRLHDWLSGRKYGNH